MDIVEFYQKATGHQPYPYQSRLATTTTLPALLSVPTGVGKTAATILAWLYRRRYADSTIRNATPRRLVYCLPMRTLVEQTYEAALQWLANLGIPTSESLDSIGVHLLMGGEEDGRWYASPEREAILIGTQDILLSRALNRGYGMSRYQWPVQFALLNNDCLWVVDETQLMGVGLTTSAQLAGFREKLSTYGNQHTIWMSATLDSQPIETIDHPQPSSSSWPTEALEEVDRSDTRVNKLLEAHKPCRKLELSLSPDNKKDFAKNLASEIVQSHVIGTLTLVVVNRVLRSQEVLVNLQKLYAKNQDTPELALVHSRFRKGDRDRIQNLALDESSLPSSGRVVIATQAIEAGVDLSATTLITELAPWSSLVQRFGRCNRRGLCGLDGSPSAQVLWIDFDTSQEKRAAEIALPYEISELDRSRDAIESLQDVGPASLGSVSVETPQPLVHVLRRKDLIDLFDTTSDLSGNELDISRFIRESEDTDVLVYWRDWDGGSKATDPPLPLNADGQIIFPAPIQAELCPVSISSLKGNSGFIKKARDRDRKAYCWSALDRQWQVVHPHTVRPGMTLLFHVSTGGYSEQTGWTGDTKDGPVPSLQPESGRLEDAMDREEAASTPLTLEEHLQDVGLAAESLREQLKGLFPSLPWDAVVRAAWWHDVGKAHPAFQGAMRTANPLLATDQLWAKSGKSGYLRYQISEEIQAPADSDSAQQGTVAVATKPQLRSGFRHELASALAWLQQHQDSIDADLIAYLIAAHHGKVRLSIRSLPNETVPKEPDRLFARGVWEGDSLPEIEIGNAEGDQSAAVDLSLQWMQLGETESGPSWLARTVGLRDQYGPFRLAYLETLVRIADWRGTEKGAQQ